MSAVPTAQVNVDDAAPQDILARIERLPLSSWQIKTRIIVGTATFFDAFDALSIAYVLPVIVPLWKLAPAQIGTLISFGFLGQLIGALIGGSLAERFGRRPVIIVAVIWFGLLSFACGFAWSYDSLLVLRLLQGLGLGAEVPVAATYISELARAQRPRAVRAAVRAGVSARPARRGDARPLDRADARLAIPVLRRRHAGAARALHDAQSPGVAALARRARPRPRRRASHGLHRKERRARDRQAAPGTGACRRSRSPRRGRPGRTSSAASISSARW